MPGQHHRAILSEAARFVAYHIDWSRHKEALDLAREHFGASRKALGEDDPDTIAIMSTLSMLCFKTARYEECLEWISKDLEAQSKVLGDDHAEIPRFLLCVARAQCRLKRLDEAVASAEECVALSKRAPGPDQAETLQRMYLLARIYRLDGVGRHKEALLLMQQVLEAAMRTLGPDHSFTISARWFADSWSMEAERAREIESAGPTTLEDQKDVQGTPPETIEDPHTAQRKDTDKVREPLGTPSDPGAELPAAPRAEPGEGKDQHIPNASAKADTEPSLEAVGLENEQPIPSPGKQK